MDDDLQRVIAGGALGEAEAENLFGRVLDGEIGDDHLSAMLIALADRGETADEITGALKAMKARAITISAPNGAIDCCGTGGDGQHTYNISSAVSFVAAACGVPVAKHGNRAASSKSGAADMLESLGVNLEVAPARLETALREIGFAFLMAPVHHPALRRVAAVRKSLGRRTIFNLLGPLANPACVRRQLTGVYEPRLLPLFGEVLRRQNAEKAWIVHSEDGLDEVSTAAPTQVHTVGQTPQTFTIRPRDLGLAAPAPDALRGGSAAENGKAFLALLSGAAGPYHDIVLVNAAAALCVADKTADLSAGLSLAAQAIDHGKARKLFEEYRTFSHG